jgi:hypothetical protein
MFLTSFCFDYHFKCLDGWERSWVINEIVNLVRGSNLLRVLFNSFHVIFAWHFFSWASLQDIYLITWVFFFFFLDLHNAFSITFLYILLNVIRFMCISFPFPCGRLHISWNPVMIVLLSACEPASQKIILPSKLVSTKFSFSVIKIVVISTQHFPSSFIAKKKKKKKKF